MNTTGRLYSVSCVSMKFCATTNDSGGASALDNGIWSDIVQVDRSNPMNTLSSVSCATTDNCVAVENGGATYRLRSSGWTISIIPNQPVMSTVSCPTATMCIAGDENGHAYNFLIVDEKWTSAEHIVGGSEGYSVNSISCADQLFCMAVAVDGYAIRYSK